MDSKKIILIVIAIAIIVFGAAYILGSSTNSNVNVTVNNTTNVSSNVTNATNVTNVTSDDTAQSSASENYESSSQSSSSGSSDPKYGSSSYVERWDQSQRAGDSWAYTHDQPVKSDSKGNEYKRMYDEDSGESYWYKMNQ